MCFSHRLFCFGTKWKVWLVVSFFVSLRGPRERAYSAWLVCIQEMRRIIAEACDRAVCVLPWWGLWILHIHCWLNLSGSEKWNKMCQICVERKERAGDIRWCNGTRKIAPCVCVCMAVMRDGRRLPLPIIATAFFPLCFSPPHRQHHAGHFPLVSTTSICKMKAVGFGGEYRSSLCMCKQMLGNYRNHFNDTAPLLPRCLTHIIPLKIKTREHWRKQCNNWRITFSPA